MNIKEGDLVTLKKEPWKVYYIFWVDKTDTPHICSSVYTEGDQSTYWPVSIDNIERVWREII